ncbi:MAG: imidazolonepropionase [Chitinophagaceae bacterium]|nr:imidazolonepropionase [Chitinophagaceae bacterium]
MRTLYSNIKQLVHTESTGQEKKVVKGEAMRCLNNIDDAWLLTENGLIVDFGAMATIPESMHAEKTVDCSGRFILPAWVDSHTHLVFAQWREQEFTQRIQGLSYEEIARRGGGILNSAARMKETNEDALFDAAMQRLHEVIQQGTGAIEIKSGYGLDTEQELKMLRVIRRIKENAPIPVKASFLAAHTYPLAYRENHQGYIDLIINTMLPCVAGEGLADYMDVFCERGFFSREETEQLLEAGLRYGLKPKIHANQLYNSGGVQAGVAYGAVSVDHLETIDDAEIACLLNSNTIPTLLPGAAFFLNMHYQPARRMIDAGLPIALASDYNPGSCPSGNMNFIISLACTQMQLLPEEAIMAATLNAAAALEMENELGSIARGKKAHLILSKPMPSLAFWPYRFADSPIEQVILH